MSLAAFSVLVVAFLLITGEASVIPSRSPASASPSFDSTGNPSSSFHTTTTNLLTGSIPSTNNDQEKSRDTRIPRLRINQVEQNWPEGLKEWSDEAFAEWCYADVDDIFDDEDESFRTNREKVAEKKLRTMVCGGVKNPSMSRFETLVIEELRGPSDAVEIEEL